ncbi:uncharacterized protein UHO2_01360 [Ustilago hordei]|uniref:uncharacterized protein n=1 Tax=Ustilago hordei TaxID=120017 RepID=UPI001A4921D2|nr:uncharacterized protein UHO2_01360 [Ustilago hordei]SYW74494.1 uncharacterized protein UHO2_01360 [Ustilago hordei]
MEPYVLDSEEDPSVLADLSQSKPIATPFPKFNPQDVEIFILEAEAWFKFNQVYEQTRMINHMGSQLEGNAWEWWTSKLHIDRACEGRLFNDWHYFTEWLLEQFNPQNARMEAYNKLLALKLTSNAPGSATHHVECFRDLEGKVNLDDNELIIDLFRGSLTHSLQENKRKVVLELTGTVQDHPAHILTNTGTGLSIVSDSFISKYLIPTKPSKTRSIHGVTGHQLVINSAVTIQVVIGKHSLGVVEVSVADTTDYDLILGFTKLRRLKPTIRWDTGQLEFNADKGVEMEVEIEKKVMVADIPKPYQHLHDVFNKVEADRLPQHTKHDLHLELMEGRDKWKTVFGTQLGLYEYLVLPFRLANAPAHFQSFINIIFQDIIRVYVVVYLDDFLIFSDMEEAHMQHVTEVLTHLRNNWLFAKLLKCEFHTMTVEFLGYIIKPTGVEMDPEKVWTVKEWPMPESIHDIQRFLGFANFYRQFIAHFA